PYYFNTFAGNAYGGNGTGSQAIFNYPGATAVDGAGNVYVADTYNYTVRKITPAGVVTTLAGLAGYDRPYTDATGSDARFNYLNGIAARSEEHTSELQSLAYLVCRLLLEKKKIIHII